jgi:hypothetical protein
MLTLAIEVTRRESPARCRQVDCFLSSRPWEDVATFCASCAPSRALNLMPWQVARCNLHQDYRQGHDPDPRRGGDAALALLQRMQQCGVSRWHPDPVAACEAVERAKNQPAK